jgi:hypothetical protein
MTAVASAAAASAVSMTPSPAAEPARTAVSRPLRVLIAMKDAGQVHHHLWNLRFLCWFSNRAIVLQRMVLKAMLGKDGHTCQVRWERERLSPRIACKMAVGFLSECMALQSLMHTDHTHPGLPRPVRRHPPASSSRSRRHRPGIRRVVRRPSGSASARHSCSRLRWWAAACGCDRGDGGRRKCSHGSSCGGSGGDSDEAVGSISGELETVEWSGERREGEKRCAGHFHLRFQAFALDSLWMRISRVIKTVRHAGSCTDDS